MIAVLAYILPLDLVYNVWIPIGVFSLLDFVANIFSNNKNKKHEKNTILIGSLIGTNID
jgi:hypothetical protein